MKLRKSTRVWLVVLAVGIGAELFLERRVPNVGCWRVIAALVIAQAACILLWRAGLALFRVIIRRLTLRLAFSYFLIGIVPIPLLAALLFLGAYVAAHQYVANRLRREITTVGETAARSDARLPELVVGPGDTVTSSSLAWLPAGSAFPWVAQLERPGFLVHGDAVWLAVRRGSAGAVRLVPLSDPESPWLQQLADLTGYEVGAEVGTSRQNRKRSGITVTTDSRDSDLNVSDEGVRRFPKGGTPSGSGLWDGRWFHGFYLETALNAVGEQAETGRNLAVLIGITSPGVLFRQLFTQGVPEVVRVARVALVVLTGIVLAVYAAALAVAFVLVGSIARNVNRLTRATKAIARGDFTARVNSKSRDQIGDLARSFDGMAASMQGALAQTARKERLESEIAIARTIQQKLLPAPEAALEGVSVLAHFEPMAEIGGDYYDYLPMPDGRIAFALGDVSGHGLPTGLLVAMAKSALSSLVEAGHQDGELFARLNDLIHRSTDPRHYMTLALLEYDARAREGVLTNAGQLAPYRVRGAEVEALALPSFPLGLFAGKAFPSRRVSFEAGDLVVFLSDGLVEAVDASEEAFGFERFESVLRDHALHGAAAIRDALLAAVAAHSGSRPAEDDRTLLILTLGDHPPAAVG